MIRLFDIRDTNVIQRLQTHTRPLASQLVAVEGINPLREAMRSYVSGGRDHAVCLVERDPDHELEAFGLMFILPDTRDHDETPHQKSAALITIAPAPRTDEHIEAWMYMGQEFASFAAQRGVHHIVAEVPEGGGESEALQAAGFAPLIQQDTLKLAKRIELKESDVAYVPGLREQVKEDEPIIKALHLRCAPKMTYSAEASIDALLNNTKLERGWVIVRANEIVASVVARSGKRGYALYVLFRPEVEHDAKAMLQHALLNLNPRRPVYCTIRHYQSWLLPIFDELGFAHLVSTTLMVRHTAVRVQQPVWSTTPKGATARSQNPISFTFHSHEDRTESFHNRK